MFENDESLKRTNEKIAFNQTIKFLAAMVVKYGDLIQPATIEDIMEYLNKQNKKTA